MFNEMETNIKIFENPTFGSVRTISDENGEPLFCLADVCKAVELTNTTTVKKRLDAEDVQLIDLHALNYNGKQIIGNSKANFITESGFYDVLLESSSPKVKPFRRWVTHEVLPSIRRHGGYIMAKEEETEEELLARALKLAQSRIDAQKKALANLHRLNVEMEQTIQENDAKLSVAQEQIRMQGIELKRSAEAVKYHDQVLSSVSTYTVTQIAKKFSRGAKTLNEKLHMCGIQYKLNGQWLLYSQYCDKDYTRTITFTVTDAMGCMHTRQSTEWTEKGRKFIHKQIEKHK